jgi:hypothetical protein
MITLVKYPEERRVFYFDFSQQPELESFDTLTGTPAVTQAVRSGSGALTLGTPFVSEARVGVEISGGVLASSYTLQCNVTTSRGSILSGSGILLIRADA